VERRLVFTGDLGQPEVLIVNDPTEPGRADWVVTESTYGDRDHDHADEVEEQLATAINETVARGGKVVIPTFAIERAQELILHLSALVEEGRIPRLRAFLDSPMAIDATEIFRRHLDYMDARTRERVRAGRLARLSDWFQFCRTTDESKEINEVSEPCIILAGSGMCTGGRIKHHLAQNIERPESTILFVGYQAEGTLGRAILDGEPEVRILGEHRAVRAHVRPVHGLSAHAGRDDLLRWLGSFEPAPRRVFVTHGEEGASLALADRVRDDLGLEASVPTWLEQADLD
jgi:metallo-beta-lactamase family protein